MKKRRSNGAQQNKIRHPASFGETRSASDVPSDGFSAQAAHMAVQLRTAVSNGAHSVLVALRGCAQHLSAFFAAVGRGFTAACKALGHGVAAFFSAVGHGIVLAASTVAHGISAFFAAVGRGFTAVCKALGHGVTAFFSAVGHGIALAAGTVAHGISAFFAAVGRGFTAACKALSHGVTAFFSAIGHGLMRIVHWFPAQIERVRAAREAKRLAQIRALEAAQAAQAAEEARIAEEARRAEAERLAAAERAAEAARQAEAERIAAAERAAKEARRAEEARIVEEARRAEEARIAAIKRAAEEARLAEEARIAEEERQKKEAFERAKARVVQHKMRGERPLPRQDKLVSEANFKPTRHITETEHPYTNGDFLYLFGKRYPVVVNYNDTSPDPDSVSFREGKVILFIKRGTGLLARKKLVGDWYRGVSLQSLRLITEQLNGRIGCQGKVRVRLTDSATRWFSSNYAENLIHIHYDLAKLNSVYLNYAVVSELCTLRLRQEGVSDRELYPRYRELISRFLPNWEKLRDNLNQPFYLH